MRTHGIYFIMVTMAFAQMVFYLFFDNKVLVTTTAFYNKVLSLTAFDSAGGVRPVAPSARARA